MIREQPFYGVITELHGVVFVYCMYMHTNTVYVDPIPSRRRIIEEVEVRRTLARTQKKNNKLSLRPRKQDLN